MEPGPSPQRYLPWQAVDGAWTTHGRGYTASLNGDALRVQVSTTTARVHTVTPAPTAGTQARRDADGALVIDRGDSVERLRAAPGGVEQVWSYAQRPAEGVDLRVAVEGVAFAGRVARGLRFTAAGASGAVLYGDGEWVDATGRRTPIEAHWTGTAVALTVPPAVLDETVFPAVLDPLVGPEAVFDPTVEVHYSPTSTVQSSIASNGSEFLVAWADTRGGLPGVPWMTRVLPNGTVLDPAGIQLGTYPTGATPAVASDGSNFLVVWPTGGSIFLTSDAVVSAAGVVLSTNSLPMGGYGGPTAIAFDGTNYVVVWATGSPGPGSTGMVYALRVDATGHPVDATPIVVDATGGAANATVAASSSGYLVAWDATDIYFKRLSLTGAVLDATPRVLTAVGAERSHPAAISDGTNYYVAWNAAVGSGSRAAGVYGTLLSPTGSLVGSAATYFGTWIADTTDTTLQVYRPGVAYDGTNFLVAKAFVDRQTIQATRVNRSGVVVDTTPMSTAMTPYTTQSVNAAGAVGTGFGATFQSALGLFTSGGTVEGPPVETCTVGDQQTNAQAVYQGGDFAVVWDDQNTAYLSASLYARLSPSLSLLDTPPVQLIQFGLHPGVVSTGSNLLVTWNYALPAPTVGYAAQKSLTGPVGTTHTLDNPGTVVAFGGGVGLAVSPPGVGLPTAGGTYVQRVGADGSALDPLAIPLRIGSPLGGAFDGTNFIAYAGAGEGQCVLFQRLDTEGDLLDPDPISVPCVSGVSGGGNHVAVAFDGTNYLFVWDETGPTGLTYNGIYARRVQPSGTVLDSASIPVSSATSAQQSPAVVYDGHNFAVVWIDGLHGAGDVVGARVSSEGTVLDTTAIAISTDPAAESAPSLAVEPGGQVLVLYDHFDTALYAQRLRARIVDFESDGGADGGLPGDVPGDVYSDSGTGHADISTLLDAGGVMDAGRGDVVIVMGIDVTDVPGATDVSSAADVDAALDALPDDADDAQGGDDVATAPLDVGADASGSDVGAVRLDAGADSSLAQDAGNDASQIADTGSATMRGGGSSCDARPGRSSGGTAAWSFVGLGLVYATRMRPRRASA